MANKKKKKSEMMGPVETAAEVGKRLHDWAVNEMGYRPWSRQSSVEMPTAEDFKDVCCGPMVEAWKFVLNHVRSLHCSDCPFNLSFGRVTSEWERTVRRVKGNLEFHCQLSAPAYKVRYQGSSVFSAETSQLQAERQELGQRLTSQLTTTALMETEVDTQRRELMDAESKYRKSCDAVHDLQRRVALLTMHTRATHVDLSQYTEYTRRLAHHTKQVATLAQQPVGESVYSKQAEDGYGGGDYLETLCMKDVRETCDLISNFLQELLQGSFSTTNKLMAKRKEALWQSVEQVLSKHSSRQILTSLCINAQDSVQCLRSHTAQISIHQDIENLKFKYETHGHLLDTSTGPNPLRSVHQLLEASEQSHIDQFLETEQCQNAAWCQMERISRAKVHLDTILTRRYGGDAGALQMARHLLELEMKTVALRASLQCLDRVTEEAKKTISQGMRENEIVLAKYDKIQYFTKLTDTKQNAIRILVKQNLASQSKLESHQTEVLQYMERTVCSDSKTTAQLSSQLKDSIKKEVESFSATVSPLPIFSRVDSTYRILTADLSINRFHGNRGSTTGQYLDKVLKAVDVPLYQAPECVLPRVMKRLVELDELEMTLTRCGRLAVDSGRDSSDGECMLRHMKDVRREIADHDKKQLETLVPEVEKHLSKGPKALSACLQLQDTITKWWDQPAQHCAVNRIVDNMTLQEWTNRWTVAVTQLRQLQH